MARLEQRRRLYYAVRDIPGAAQKRLGGRRFIKSTGTSDRREAEIVAASFDVVWLEKIRRAIYGPRAPQTQEAQEARIASQAAFWRDRIANALPGSREVIIEQMKSAAAEELDPFDPMDPDGVKRAERFVEIALGHHVPLGEKLEEFLEEKAKDTEAKTIDLYRTSLRRFNERFRTSTDVTRSEVKAWVGELRDLGMADNTLQRTFSAIRGYWQYLQDRGVLPESENPFSGALRAPEKGKNRRGKAVAFKAFEPQDVVRLLNAAQERSDPELADLIRLGMWTGCRIESLCSLRVEDVTSDTLFVSDKTEAGSRLVPIHPTLKPTLKRLCEASKDGFVLSGLGENKYGDRSNAIGKRFGRLKTSLGFEGRSWAFHSIRKTVVTQLQRAGVPEEVTMSIVGHENKSITYGLYSAGPSLEQKMEAISKIKYPGQK